MKNGHDHDSDEDSDDEEPSEVRPVQTVRLSVMSGWSGKSKAIGAMAHTQSTIEDKSEVFTVWLIVVTVLVASCVGVAAWALHCQSGLADALRA